MHRVNPLTPGENRESFGMRTQAPNHKPHSRKLLAAEILKIFTQKMVHFY